MPLDVIMPALGMAQDTGVIVAWHKQPGDAVATGDVLFEVETDKATMEVEAQGDGFLTGVAAAAGEEVPVGNVIARISETADAGEEAAAEVPAQGRDAGAQDLPEGHQIIMPTLGMAQDSGLLVGWLVEPGAKVGADDPLFEVETDKSTMEVPAGAEGYLAACLAQPGEEVPTGQVIAILTPEAPAQTITRSAAETAGPAPAPEPEAEPAQTPAPANQTPPAPSRPTKTPATPAPAPAPSGRVLASPKARRLALEQGLDLSRLVAAGVPQPYHVADLETLRAMPADTASGAATASATSLHLTAEVPREGLSDFTAWARETAGLHDPAALLAGLAAPCCGTPDPVVAVETFGQRRLFQTRARNLAEVTECSDQEPALILRDLRMSRITGLRLGAEEAPVLSLTTAGDGLSLTLEGAPGQLTPTEALSLLSDFAGRVEQPLRHLL